MMLPRGGRGEATVEAFELLAFEGQAGSLASG